MVCLRFDYSLFNIHHSLFINYTPTYGDCQQERLCEWQNVCLKERSLSGGDLRKLSVFSEFKYVSVPPGDAVAF